VIAMDAVIFIVLLFIAVLLIRRSRKSRAGAGQTEGNTSVDRDRDDFGDSGGADGGGD